MSYDMNPVNASEKNEKKKTVDYLSHYPHETPRDDNSWEKYIACVVKTL